jgi:di/tricarboxylate transporter
MLIEAWITLFVLLVVLGMLVITRRPPDAILVAGVSVLVLSGVLTPAQAISGLANEGVVTIAILFAVAAGLKETGAMSLLSRGLLGRPTSLTFAQTRIMLPVAGLSAFMNNTPLVAILLPAIQDWARQQQFALSKLLIPLSFASILGGACTLVGTSTNLIINGWLINEMDHPGLGMFEPAYIGIPCALIGMGMILLLNRWLLPDLKPVLPMDESLRQYTVEVIVEKHGPVDGKTISQAGLRNLPQAFLMEIEHDNEIVPVVGPEHILHGGDRLVFVGVIDSVAELHKIHGLIPAPDQILKLNSPRSKRILIEAVVSNSCAMIGRTIKQAGFRSYYQAVVIAVARNGKKLPGRIGDIKLQPGDTLLLEALPSFVDQQHNNQDFYLISKVTDDHPPNYAKAPLALLILTGLVIVVALGWLSMFKAALMAAGLMIISGCCTATEARKAVDWQVFIAIAASIGLGKAMQVSGLDQVLVTPLLHLSDGQPYITLAVIYGCSMLLAAIITAKAAAVLMLPLAFAAAASLELAYMPFVMAVLFACSMTIATPIGYPTNMMIYGPGSYRFMDYIKIGLPISLVLWMITVLLIPIFWTF